MLQTQGARIYVDSQQFPSKKGYQEKQVIRLDIKFYFRKLSNNLIIKDSHSWQHASIYQWMV